MRQVLDDVRTRAVEAEFQEIAEEGAGADGGKDDQAGRPVVARETLQRRGDRQQREDGVAAEGGDVGHRVEEPGGADEGGRVFRQAQEGQHRSVEGVGFLLKDFIGELGEAEQARRNDAEDGDRADLAQGRELERGWRLTQARLL